MAGFNTKKEEERLRALINRWKISKSLLAAEIKMPEGTFKNKWNEGNPRYRFSEIEILKIGSAIDRMIAEFQILLNSWDTDSDDLL